METSSILLLFGTIAALGGILTWLFPAAAKAFLVSPWPFSSKDSAVGFARYFLLIVAVVLLAAGLVARM